MLITQEQLKAKIDEKLASVQVLDVHTHLFPASFDGLLLWGIDEILTYHYLIAEYFHSSMDYEQFFQSPKAEQADLVWQTLPWSAHLSAKPSVAC